MQRITNDELVRGLLDFCQRNGVAPGKKQLQKVIYLLQAHGVETGYEFGIHFYGPFSQALASDVQELVQEGQLTIERRDMTEALVPGGGFQPSQLPEEMCEVAQRYITATGKELELLATLHYLFQREDKKGDALVERLLELKPKYQRVQVQRAVQRLLQEHLLSA